MKVTSSDFKLATFFPISPFFFGGILMYKYYNSLHLFSQFWLINLAVRFTGNDIYDSLTDSLAEDKKHLLDEFEKSFGQKRNNYWNGQWDGNQLKEIIQEKNLSKMEQILPKEVSPFIESFRKLRIVYRTTCSNSTDAKDSNEDIRKRKMKQNESVINENITKEEKLASFMKECQDSIDDFISSINFLKKDYNFSKTPKIHTIEDHIMDIIELTGEPLGSLDQCIEQLHQYFNQRMHASHYYVKTKDKDIAGTRLMQCVNHINSFNLYN